MVWLYVACGCHTSLILKFCKGSCNKVDIGCVLAIVQVSSVKMWGVCAPSAAACYKAGILLLFANCLFLLLLRVCLVFGRIFLVYM